MGIWNALECWFLPHLVLGIRSSVGILALPLRPLYSSISLLSFLLFLRDSHFNCPRMQSYFQFHNCKFLSWIWLLAFARFLILPEDLHRGGGGGEGGRVPNRIVILQDWAHQSFISCFFYFLGQEYKFRLRNPVNIAYMCISFQVICNCYSKVFDAFNIFEISSL